MKKNSSQQGFSLVEALVAIFILTVVIAAPLQIAYQGIAATTYAKNQLTAQFLAQDVAEFILAEKKQNEEGWLDNTFDVCRGDSDEDNGCIINTDGTGAIQVDACGATCPVMKLNVGNGSDKGIYSQDKSGSNWQNTEFRRKIVLQQVEDGSDDEIRAYIIVSWSSSLDAKKSFTLRYNFYKEVLQ